ncbi:GNAT family N-acetyltransferase [Phycicoccus sp. CSK15P-2]|uniref:GNAT family N-acetyltransferase n=1 Tax=Phycicoccus sp. CSK15P-2 TaxID=2807627 RepID=UPI0019500FC2|nr:GNAT family N-acetyltransferase [Phycicoccus sp. CSK15P-2]MBM6404938.1 GNAT family N-acetyltransferase [Phycicoccus sp. CSK15P-2]
MDEDSPYRVVAVTPETSGAFDAVDDVVWFDEPDPTGADPSGGLDPSRRFAASRTGEPPFAGVFAWYDHRLTVPGPQGPAPAPCAGLAWVGVHPDARRTGVLTAMLGHHLADVHEQGYALAALHASELGIYGRFGYGQASFGVHVEVGGGAEVTAPGVDPGDVRTTVVPGRGDDTADRVHRVQAAVAAGQVGAVALTEAHTRRRFQPDPRAERGRERPRLVVATRDGADVGYAVVQRAHKWEDMRPQGTLECSELVAADPAVRLALLRRLVSFDLIGTVTLPADSVEDELVWWLGGPRAVKARVHDALWLRLVDVGAALGMRGYVADLDLVLDVVDERCPWNAGRRRLRTVDGHGGCERTHAAADVRLPVQALGSAYLGGRSVAAMARQGLVEEHRPGAVAALGRALATDVPPVAALSF